MPINATGYSHVRLTVTDIAVSRPFYDQVFGFPVAFEVPDDADQQTREDLAWLAGGVVYTFGQGQLLGLRPVGADQFSPDRTGMDHLCLAVPSRDDLDQAARRLDELGVAHEEVKDIGVAWILEFRDPDDIALELMAAKG